MEITAIKIGKPSEAIFLLLLLLLVISLVWRPVIKMRCEGSMKELGVLPIGLL